MLTDKTLHADSGRVAELPAPGAGRATTERPDSVPIVWPAAHPAGTDQRSALAVRRQAGEKLGHQRLMTAQMMVFVMTNRFSTTRPFYGQHAAMRLPYPTDYTPDLIRAAAQAERYYRQALMLAKELGMGPLMAHCHLGLGTLYAENGQPAQARVALSAAVELYRAMEMTCWLPQAEARLAQVDA